MLPGSPSVCRIARRFEHVTLPELTDAASEPGLQAQSLELRREPVRDPTLSGVEVAGCLVKAKPICPGRSRSAGDVEST